MECNMRMRTPVRDYFHRGSNLGNLSYSHIRLNCPCQFWMRMSCVLTSSKLLSKRNVMNYTANTFIVKSTMDHLCAFLSRCLAVVSTTECSILQIVVL